MIKVGSLLFALILGLGSVGPVFAGFEEGVAAYKRGDYAAALRELRPLAEQGLAQAQLYLGVMYAKGWGAPQDQAESVQWYSMAARQGVSEALKWFRMAAGQGDAEAQLLLGIMYAEGQGVLQDYVLAHMWFNLAAARSAPNPHRGEAARSRDLVAEKMMPAQIAEAQRLAREWKPKKP